MSWTKREIVNQMYAELALAGYQYDLSPEEMQFACVRLDALFGRWAGQGIQVGYAFGLNPTDTDLDQDSGLPLTVIEAAYLNGAINIASAKGKQMAAPTRINAKAAFDAMLVDCSKRALEPQQFRNDTPAGAGNKPWRSGITQPFLPPPQDDGLGLAADGNLQLGN